MQRKSPDRFRPADPSFSGRALGIRNCLTALHTITKCRLKINHSDVAQSLNGTRTAKITRINSIYYDPMPARRPLARRLRHPFRAPPFGGSRNMGRSTRQREQANGFWQDFTTASVAGQRRTGARNGFRRTRARPRRHHDRLHLCRLARRLRLQPGPRAGCCGAEEDRRPQGGRGRKGPGDRRGREDHRVHDQSRRRLAAVPDLVRLLQPAHDQDGEQVSKTSLRALRRAVERQGSEERRQLFRLYRRGPVHFRHRRRLLLQERQARLRRGETDPAGAAQHQRLHARRQARQPEGDHCR